jgi:hypothetical protein
MKKLFAVVAIGAAAITLAAPANAAPSWTEDESASICNYLSLQTSVPSTDWVSLNISMLQLQYDATRAEAVAGIRAAAVGYCPKNLPSVPSR